MLYIKQLQRIYSCLLKANRLIDDTDGVQPYQRIDNLTWTAHAQQHDKLIKIKDFPKGHRVNHFRLVLSTQRTNFVVTNELVQDNVQVAQEVYSLHWKIEQFHRETKLPSGLEGCQCRFARIVHNPIAYAMIVWVRLKHLSTQAQQTVYQLNHFYDSCVSARSKKDPTELCIRQIITGNPLLYGEVSY